MILLRLKLPIADYYILGLQPNQMETPVFWFACLGPDDVLKEDDEMATLTIYLPDDKHARLRQLAKHQKTSVNKLMEELATIALAQFDAETRFRACAARGSAAEGL